MKNIILLLLILSSTLVFSQPVSNPVEVEKVLKLAGPNRNELEKAIQFFRKKKDPLKLKAINFLVANMDIHFSANYYWADTVGKRIEYNELNYPDLEASLASFAELKKRTTGIHPVTYTVRDIDSIKAGFLINNVEQAFKTWKSSLYKQMSFDEFCEYILPYRVSVEPLQDWREIYKAKFAWMNDTAKKAGVEKTLAYFATDCKTWFSNTYGDQDPEPLPRLGAMQLLHRKRGACEDMADLAVFALQSQGFPVTANFIPYWATSTGRHFFNGAFNLKLEETRYDLGTVPALNADLSREPSKVLRSTYAKQPDALAQHEEQKNIPDGFMRSLNYIDVTDKHWPTSDLKSKLFPVEVKQKFAYLCVFNGLGWKPTWWGEPKSDSVSYSKMSKGAVYLPAWYVNGKIVPAAYPIALGYNHEQTLAPDMLKRRKVVIEEQEKYLIFQPAKRYRLFYWDNAWKIVAEKMPALGTLTLEFDDVPTNALLLLVPEYSKGKERPFMINDDGKRIWW